MSRGRFDVAVVGAGPAGLAVALEASLRGLSAVVIEKHTLPRDKACGEGLMPPGVRALGRLGVLPLLGPDDCAPLTSIRYMQEDGTSAEAPLPQGGGLGVRRIALSRAMAERARQLGVALHEGCAVVSHERCAHGVTLATSAGEVRARLLVAADGLHSSLRRAAGLEAGTHGQARFGLRQHFRIAPWSTAVEVHLSDGVEAYVTPTGRERVGIAFLWAKQNGADAPTYAALLHRFPVLSARLIGAPADSSPRGAGPFVQRARACVGNRLVLIGDAAGYVDALTGEGVSLALVCAEALGRVLPRALASGATAASFARYTRVYEEEFSRYAFLARGVLALTRRPRLRRAVVRLLAAQPAMFTHVLAHACG